MMRSGTSFFGEMAMNVELSRETRDLINTLRAMLAQAERGEIVLSSLRVTNTQKDRWESVAGTDAERMRLDNKYRVELEMYTPDKKARAQRPVEPVRVEVDKDAEALLNGGVNTDRYADDPLFPVHSWGRVTLRAPGRKWSTNDDVATRPLWSLAQRIESVLGRSPGRYTGLQMRLDTLKGLMLEGIINDPATAKWLGLDLIIPDRKVPKPTFDDDDVSWTAPTTTRMKPKMRTDPTTTRMKSPAEPPKPNTPVGASAGREIIFDD